MKLYVMRHGPAEDFAPSGRDGDRALTTSGRERVRAVAKLLATEGEAPRMIVSSPLVRAMQTAEIVAAELGIDNVETGHELAPGGDAAVLARALRGTNASGRCSSVTSPTSRRWSRPSSTNRSTPRC